MEETKNGEKKRVLILGGTGEMGQWFTRFFKERGYEVTVWGKGGKVEIAEKMGVEFASDLNAAIGKSEIVIVSVSINVTEQVIAETAPKMKPGSLLMDLTSIKEKPVSAMQRFAPPDVEILGTHPMFGPTIPTLRGQTVFLVPVEGRSEKWFQVIRKLFEENGAHVEITTAAEHDRLVSVVQGLTHFAYITIGTTFERLDFDVGRSRKFVSPVYDIMLDFVGRILGQNPYLYALIQMENPAVLEVHKAFIEECKKVSEMVKAHETEAFVEHMKKASRHYGDTAHALRRSDKLINSRIREFEEILHSIGKERGFYHIYSEKTHVGIVEKVSQEEVTLVNPKAGEKRKRLKLENLRLLSEEELKAWKIENLRHFKRDISVLIPNGADPAVLLDVIARNKKLAAVEIIDTYLGCSGTDRQSITYRITIMEDCKPETVEEEVTKLLLGLGCWKRT